MSFDPAIYLSFQLFQTLNIVNDSKSFERLNYYINALNLYNSFPLKAVHRNSKLLLSVYSNHLKKL